MTTDRSKPGEGVTEEMHEAGYTAFVESFKLTPNMPPETRRRYIDAVYAAIDAALEAHAAKHERSKIPSMPNGNEVEYFCPECGERAGSDKAKRSEPFAHCGACGYSAAPSTPSGDAPTPKHGPDKIEAALRAFHEARPEPSAGTRAALETRLQAVLDACCGGIECDDCPEGEIYRLSIADLKARLAKSAESALVEPWPECFRALAVLVLQSKLYEKDSDIRQEVDNVLGDVVKLHDGPCNGEEIAK